MIATFPVVEDGIDSDLDLAKLDRDFRDRELAWIVDQMLVNFDHGFSCLVECYDRYIHTVARCIVAPEDVDDIVQEAFMRAYIALKTYTPERVRMLKVRPWLRTVVRNVALNYSAYKARRETLSLELLEEGGRQLRGDKFNAAEELLVRVEIESEINSWLEYLPPADRIILELHFGTSDQTYSMMGKELDITGEAVKKRVHRAIRRVRGILGERFGDGATRLSELISL